MTLQPHYWLSQQLRLLSQWRWDQPSGVSACLAHLYAARDEDILSESGPATITLYGVRGSPPMVQGWYSSPIPIQACGLATPSACRWEPGQVGWPSLGNSAPLTPEVSSDGMVSFMCWHYCQARLIGTGESGKDRVYYRVEQPALHQTCSFPSVESQPPQAVQDWFAHWLTSCQFLDYHWNSILLPLVVSEFKGLGAAQGKGTTKRRW